jgi:hypothetical protein
MNKSFWFCALLATCLVPGVSAAQTMERTKNWDVGDKMTYNLVMNGQPMRLVEEVMEIASTEIRVIQQVDGRTYQAAHSTGDLSRVRGMCFTNGEACEWMPGDVWADFPLQRGKSWSFKVTVTGETFISEQTSERKVVGFETVKTAAGEFQAFKVFAVEKIRFRPNTGAATWNEGTANFTYWLTTINGKLVFLKNEYKNSFGRTFTRELVSAELQ